MEAGLFYLFSALALLCALLVVANPFSRNPVTSAMFLVLTIGWLAGLFVLLRAFFLAAVQILVYAGAVMVLFLFVIMLLNLEQEARRRLRKGALALALLAVGAVVAMVLRTAARSDLGAGRQPKIEGGTAELGRLLFAGYLLPFEIVSVLLLVAMVGVVLLSKKESK